MKPHVIPNMGFAHVEERFLLRIFFPRLYAVDRTDVALTKTEQSAVYDDGLRPAIEHVSAENSMNWPPNHEANLWRSKNHRTGRQYGTRPIAASDVAAFCSAFRANLGDRHPWAKDMVFMTQIQGVKEAHQHHPVDADTYLRRILNGVDTSGGVWFVDVGFEVSERGRVYQWRADAHWRIIQEVTGLSERLSRRAADPTNWGYGRDISAHLLDLCGCRLTLASDGPFNACYLQLYHTEKQLTYHHEGYHHAKHITCAMAMDKRSNYMEDMVGAFQAALKNMDGAARVELRVPLQFATAVMPLISNAALSVCLATFEREDWWSVLDLISRFT